jgi:hypothetical protein
VPLGRKAKVIDHSPSDSDRQASPGEAAIEIQVAGAPRTIEREEGNGSLSIEIPLTDEPDELLLKELRASPPLSSLCDSIELREQSLLIHPNEGGLEALKTMLTAVVALIETANEARAEAAMSEEEREAAAAAAQRRQVQAELEAWWGEQGRELA